MRVVLFILLSIVAGCSRTNSSDTTKHYSEEFFLKLSKKSADEKSRDHALSSIDSLYNTFPTVSVADRYRYYDFKRHLFELIRYSDNSYDTAIFYLDSMIALIETKGLEKEMSKEYVKAFTIRSDFSARRQRYADAIEDLNRCRELNREAGDSCLIADNTRTLSLLAIKQSDFSQAAFLLKEALQLAEKCKNDGEQFVRKQRYLDDLGYVYTNMNDNDSSLFYHFAAIKYIQENKQLLKSDTIFPYVALSNIYGNISVVYFKLKKLDEAEEYIQKSIFIEKNITSNRVELAKGQMILGKILFEAGRVDEAEKVAEKSMQQLDNFDLGFKADLYKLKIDIAAQRKDYKNEAYYQSLYRLAKDSIYKTHIEILKNNPLTEYERLERKYQLELLEKDNRNQRNKKSAAIIIGILLIFLTGIILYTLRRIRNIMKKRAILYKELVQREKDLKQAMAEKEVAEKQLRDNELLTQEMELQVKFNEAIIEQRSQISDDMHDELSSSLAALKFYVDDERKKSEGTAAEKSLKDISAEVNNMYQHARSYMHSLKANRWETRFDLVDFLNEIQHKFSEKGLISVELQIDDKKIKSRLLANQHNQLYHICSEAITNIIKHARASRISIQISIDETNCYFSIEDDGVGFNEDEQAGTGLGINSIKRRIQLLHGEVKMASGKNGTTIKGSFPVE